jgi:phosphatidylglycerophosphatase A
MTGTQRVAEAIATWLYTGKSPKAPGTVGSLATLPLAYLLHLAGGAYLYVVGIALAFFVGLWATRVELERRAAAGEEAHDPGDIVIDEVAGQLIAIAPLSIALTMMDTPAHVFPWPGWVGGFVMFRFFDILKPPPVSWAERLPGAMGVMLDDVVAGVLAALVMLAAAAVAHGWF